jgi:hypothetical protein
MTTPPPGALGSRGELCDAKAYAADTRTEADDEMAVQGRRRERKED